MKPTFAHSARLFCAVILAIGVGLFWLQTSPTHNALGEASVIEAGAEIQPEFTKIRPPRAQLERPRPEAQASALTDMLAGHPFVLVADGRPQHFVLSLSEYYAPNAAANEKKLRTIPPQANARELIATAEREAGEHAGWVLYPAGQNGQATARQVMKKRMLIQTSDRRATIAALPKLGLKLMSEPDYAPGSLIVEPVKGGPEAVMAALQVLTEMTHVKSAGPLLSRYHAKFWTPNDRYFKEQWHLKNTGQGSGLKGFDMKVSTAWDSYRGRGVRIGIVDDGLETLHPDLIPNIESAYHYDWNDDTYDNDPTPHPEEDDTHGTSVAGVAAAFAGNSIGVSGVAPEAKLVGLRLISSGDIDGTSDEEDAEAMTHRNDVIHIKNSSWGSSANYREVYAAGPLMEAAREDGALNGRGGKGTIYVWAAGNGRDYGEQGQKDGVTSSIYINTVSALNNKGGAAYYSETGSHIIVSAPSSGGSRGIYSTDLIGKNGYNKRGSAQGEPSDLNYTDSFGGTSSASPAIAGMIALMLEANPNLNWRDVKEILLRSSTKISPTSSDWISHSGGRPSLPPIKHHHTYGGGAADAATAVDLASKWDSLGSMIEVSRSDSSFSYIPDNDSAGISINFDFSTSTTAPMRVEQAKLQFNVEHEYRGDLEITLRSPTGSSSKLAYKQGRDSGRNYDDWIFNSVRHWGESANGIWTLTIKDLAEDDSGYYHDATLTLYGTDAPATNIATQTSGPLFLEDGQPLNLSVQATAGSGSIDYLWEKNDSKLIYTNASINVPISNHTMGGTYKVTVSNINSSDSSEDIRVGIVKRTLPAMIINVGTTMSLPVPAAGPGLSYHWKREGELLENGGKISGADSDTLIITDMQTEDEGAYTCVVSMEGIATTIETLPAAISVRLKPVVVAPENDNGVISGLVNRQFTAENGATKYTISKLPPGVTFNTATGLLSGRPTKAGFYTLTITAMNLAGTSPPLTYLWQIEDFPLAARGTWRGTVQRTPLNADLGGRLSITVSKTGSYSGKITLGAKSYSWTSRINAEAGNQTSITPVSIRRSKTTTPLTGNITLKLDDGTLTGSVTDSSFSADVTAVRNPWSSLNLAVPVLTVFNNALESPESVLDNPLYPQGNGYVIHKLSTSGAVSSAGRLADGTSFTHSTYLGLDGQVPIHRMLYSNTGSIQGDSSITRTTELVLGNLSWLKNQQSSKSTTRSYKGGIPLHTLGVRGARYSKPIGMIISLNTPVNIPPEDNAKLRFSGLLLNPPFDYTFPIIAGNVPKIPTSLAANAQSVKLKLDPKTGLFSGSFSISVTDPRDLIEPYATLTRNPTYRGLLVNHPELTAGVGHFLLNELPTEDDQKLTSTPIHSGKMELTRP